MHSDHSKCIGPHCCAVLHWPQGIPQPFPRTFCQCMETRPAVGWLGVPNPLSIVSAGHSHGGGTTAGCAAASSAAPAAGRGCCCRPSSGRRSPRAPVAPAPRCWSRSSPSWRVRRGSMLTVHPLPTCPTLILITEGPDELCTLHVIGRKSCLTEMPNFPATLAGLNPGGMQISRSHTIARLTVRRHHQPGGAAGGAGCDRRVLRAFLAQPAAGHRRPGGRHLQGARAALSHTLPGVCT